MDEMPIPVKSYGEVMRGVDRHDQLAAAGVIDGPKLDAIKLDIGQW